MEHKTQEHMNRLEEIRQREKKATPGPWNNSVGGSEYVDNGEGFKVCLTRRSRDADFIAHAREDIPWLLERIGQLERQLAAAVEDIPHRCYTCRNKTSENKCLSGITIYYAQLCNWQWRGHTSETEDAT